MLSIRKNIQLRIGEIPSPPSKKGGGGKSCTQQRPPYPRRGEVACFVPNMVLLLFPSNRLDHSSQTLKTDPWSPAPPGT